jgi:hypothetical protein
LSGEAPIERLLFDQEVKWEPIPLEGCSFVGDPDAVYATHQGTLEIGAERRERSEAATHPTQPAVMEAA